MAVCALFTSVMTLPLESLTRGSLTAASGKNCSVVTALAQSSSVHS